MHTYVCLLMNSTKSKTTTYDIRTIIIIQKSVIVFMFIVSVKLNVSVHVKVHTHFTFLVPILICGWISLSFLKLHQLISLGLLGV